MMPLKCSNRFNIVFDHFRLSFNDVNTVYVCKHCVKYQYASRAVCAYARGFRKRPGCALFGACALIRTNTVFPQILLCEQRSPRQLNHYITIITLGYRPCTEETDEG